MLYNGERISDKNSPDMEETLFKRYKFRILGTPMLMPKGNAQFLSTLELLKHYTPANSIEFQWRATFPFTILNMMIIGWCICRVLPKQGRFLNIIYAILIFIVYYNCIIAINSIMIHHAGNAKINLWQLNHFVLLLGSVWLWYLGGCCWFNKFFLKKS